MLSRMSISPVKRVEETYAITSFSMPPLFELVHDARRYRVGLYFRCGRALLRDEPPSSVDRRHANDGNGRYDSKNRELLDIQDRNHLDKRWDPRNSRNHQIPQVDRDRDPHRLQQMLAPNSK
jgi:hypothetical protein